MCPALFCFDCQNHLTSLRKLNGISNQVYEHLLQEKRIADERVRRIGRDTVGEFNVFLVRTHADRLNGVAQSLAQIKVDGIELKLSSLTSKYTKCLYLCASFAFELP